MKLHVYILSNNVNRSAITECTKPKINSSEACVRFPMATETRIAKTQAINYIIGRCNGGSKGAFLMGVTWNIRFGNSI